MRPDIDIGLCLAPPELKQGRVCCLVCWRVALRCMDPWHVRACGVNNDTNRGLDVKDI